MLELLELPDDLLLKVLAGCGARRCARVATCCKRLQKMAASCGDRDSIYCSALSDRGTLREALTDATNRALEGITGTSVDFALVFISSYPARECQHVVPTLRRLLPQGAGIIGCTVDGLMGLDAKGQGMEKDPSEKKKAKEAVAVLVGRVAGSHVCLFADDRAVVKQEQEEPGAPFCRGLSACMGPAVAHAESAPPDSARSQKRGPRNQPAQPAKPAGLTTSGPAPDRLSRNFLAPSCVWLLGRVDECYSLMSWIEAAWEGQVPVAGGLTSTFFYSPGAGQASRLPHMTARDLKAAAYVGVALCPKQSQYNGSASGSSSRIDTTAMRQAAHADAASTGPATSPSQMGTAPGASVPPAPLASPSPALGAVGVPRSPSTRAAALTFVGVGAEVDAKVYRTSEMTALNGHVDGMHVSLSMKLVSVPGACSAVDFIHELYSMSERQSPVEGLAIWPEGNGDRCSLELLQKGQALILSATNALDAVISSDGSVVVKSMVYMGNDTEKKRLFQLPRQCQTFNVQLVSINIEACQAQIPRDLQVLQRACYRAPEQDPTHYWHAQQSAADAGACSSPMALVAFSCNGRGQKIFGQDKANSEAHLVANATHSSVAFIGGRMLGEIGPELLSSNGLAGWGFSPATLEAMGHNLSTTIQTQPAHATGPGSTSGESISSLHGNVPQTEGRVLIIPELDGMPARELALGGPNYQGYTTVYAAVC
uniref:F-box domain-containing protein n=1 Tax=Dunaliella tertiolecta TaxID=3047 RepID=A0A7S3VJ31_DUNTE|mmetsp:Transcript_20807/g.58003  ORF Transcript_20807/g.58003 Transcript_20807/m.58003 type:complete len:711 (+) Transcript_20807:52-2184(+)